MNEKFLVTFGDTQEVYTEEQLSNFIKTAVIHNKDINNFTVNRLEISDVDINECGEIEPQYDFKEYESNDAFFNNVTSLIISELEDYSLKSNCSNIIEKLDRIRTTMGILSHYPTIKDQFEIAALRILNNKI